jgi:hypothetical protein
MSINEHYNEVLDVIEKLFMTMFEVRRRWQARRRCGRRRQPPPPGHPCCPPGQPVLLPTARTLPALGAKGPRAA